MTEESTGLDLAPSVHAVATVAAGEERKKLRRSVGRLDTAFLMLAAIIVLDMLGAVSSYGAQAFTWLVVMIIFFLVPYGLLTAELGSAFPEEGGPYVWVKLAFGRAAAAVVSVMYWVDNPIWLAGTLAITAMATFSTFFVTLSLAWQYVFGLDLRLGGHRHCHHGAEVRQVGGHRRCRRPRRLDGAVHAHRRLLRRRARRARLRRRGVQAHVGRVPAGGAHPRSSTWRASSCRAAHRGAEEPAPGRAVRRAALRDRHGAVLRRADPGHPAGASPGAAVQRRRFRRRAADRLRRLRWSHDRVGHRADRCGQDPRGRLRDRGDLRAAVVGRGLAHRFRPHPGGRGIRRRRAAMDGGTSPSASARRSA